jgi:gamma-glutamyltranspeptidase
MTRTVSHPRGSAAVTPHVPATRTAVEVMTASGNAADAAIAAPRPSG